MSKKDINFSKEKNFDKKSIIISKLKQLEEQKLSSSKKYWNISWKLGEYLSKIVEEKSPKYILEFGTSNGFSTLWIALGAPVNSWVYTIEVDENRFSEAKSNFNECFLNNIYQIRGEIFEILQKCSFDMKFDIIFIDAMQRSYVDLMKLIEEKKILSDGALVIADNVVSHGSTAEFVDYMKENYSCSIVDIDSGFLIGTYKSK